MAKRRSRSPQHAGPLYDPATVKAYAHGRWAAILAEVGGIDIDLLDGQHHPCPKCGGSDRWSFTNAEGHGSILCNQCARHGVGDGFAALGWANSWTFADCLAKVAEYLGIQPSATVGVAAGKHAGSASRESADPAKDLVPLAWSEELAGLWCLAKPPIIPGAILAAGGRLARYRSQYTVIDLPVFGEAENERKDKLQSVKKANGRTAQNDSVDATRYRSDRKATREIVGHALYNASGGTLPKYTRQPNGQPPKISHVKTKLTYGSQPGLIGTVDRLLSPDCDMIIKVEGCTDVLAVLSLPDLPATVAVVTSANGAGEYPAQWMIELWRGRRAIVVGDADKPGVEGARNWAAAIGTVAAACRLARLPYEVVEIHGRDVRDWIGELC